MTYVKIGLKQFVFFCENSSVKALLQDSWCHHIHLFFFKAKENLISVIMVKMITKQILWICALN